MYPREDIFLLPVASVWNRCFQVSYAENCISAMSVKVANDFVQKQSGNMGQVPCKRTVGAERKRVWESWLGASERLLILLRTQIYFPAPTWWLTVICNSSPGDLMSSSNFSGYQTCTWCTYLLPGKTYT